MALVRPENMDFSGQKFSAIIYGSPGVGKTTLALSAPAPVLIDFDRGISRVRANHRCPTIMCDTYEEVMADIKSPEMAEFQTIVIDTGGSFVTFLKDWAMRVKGAVQKNGEFNPLKGFGYVKAEWNSFTDYVKKVLNKNVIYIFHSEEKPDKDGNPTQRLMCEGSVRNTVWNPCDFGGYVQMIGSKRTICFSPEQEYFAKGSHGITGRYEVPELVPNVANDFMTKLFDVARDNIAKEKEEFAPKMAAYETAVAQGNEIICSIIDAESANAAMPKMKAIAHSLTSEKEINIAFNAKIKSLGLFYDRVLKQYTVSPEEA